MCQYASLKRFQSANNRVFNSEMKRRGSYRSADGRLFQSANNRVFNSEMSRGRTRAQVSDSFQSANNRVFNSEGLPFSPFAASSLQPFSANPLF